MAQLPPIVQLMRPHQWLKNGFVLIGPLFARAWSDPPLFTQALIAFAAFCAISSTIYLVNDILDREADRNHPKKRHRPLAAGTVTLNQALLTATLLLATALILGWWVSGTVVALMVIYLLLNLAYSWRLKQVVILDVFIIAAGFMLRILVGTVGIGIEPSSWLLLTGLMVTLFLGFAKRHSELTSLQQSGGQSRRVLEHYSIPFLNITLGVCTGGVIIAYSLYTISPATIAIHHTEQLIYTVPLVIYGLFRYLYLTLQTDAGEDPARDLLRDPHMLLTAIAWLAVTVAVVA